MIGQRGLLDFARGMARNMSEERGIATDLWGADRRRDWTFPSPEFKRMRIISDQIKIMAPIKTARFVHTSEAIFSFLPRSFPIIHLHFSFWVRNKSDKLKMEWSLNAPILPMTQTNSSPINMMELSSHTIKNCSLKTNTGKTEPPGLRRPLRPEAHSVIQTEDRRKRRTMP